MVAEGWRLLAEGWRGPAEGVGGREEPFRAVTEEVGQGKESRSDITFRITGGGKEVKCCLRFPNFCYFFFHIHIFFLLGKYVNICCNV